MHKIISLSIISLGLLFNVYAQKDEKAKAVLDDFSKTIQSYSSLKAEFSYNMFNKSADIDETQEGSLYLQGDKFHISVSGREIISDGKTVWVYSKKDNSVNIMMQEDFNEEEPDLNPKAIFSSYEKGFTYKYIKEDKIDGTPVDVIDLFPTEEKDYEKIRMEVNKDTKLVMRSTTFPKEKDGSTFTLNVKKIRPNPSDMASFSFDPSKYPDIEIVDFR